MFCLVFILLTTFYTQAVRGDDPLQSFFYSLQCYPSTQKGCNTKFTDVYPELSRSADNSTLAATRFYMFTNESPDEPESMDNCGGKLPPDTTFNPTCKTEILFPPFLGGICNTGILREIKNQIFKCNSCHNFLMVDSTWGNSFDYVLAVENMKIVAKQVAVVIRGLKDMYGLTDEDFICTGHSLGAQGCGFVGQNEPIAVINAYDPAGPGFNEEYPLDQRLDAGDATRCVQVTHCNAGRCLPYFGVGYNCGTKDIYYNDGSYQPACHKEGLIAFLKGDIFLGLLYLAPYACSHVQCLQYYKASICPDGCNQIAVECDSAENFLSGKCRCCGPKGEKCDVAGHYSCDCSNGKHKSYYVNTTLDCPYCDNSRVKIQGYGCPAIGLTKRKRQCPKKHTT